MRRPGRPPRPPILGGANSPQDWGPGGPPAGHAIAGHREASGPEPPERSVALRSECDFRVPVSRRRVSAVVGRGRIALYLRVAGLGARRGRILARDDDVRLARNGGPQPGEWRAGA